MKINDDHMFHGAALTQIAEHPQFTAINSFIFKREKSRCGFTVNDDIGIYLKYANEPHGGYDEYKFTFTREHLEELTALKAKRRTVVIGLVCVKDKEICALPLDDFLRLIKMRRDEVGTEEEQYQVLVTAPEHSNFRVYVNVPAAKGKTLGMRLIPRKNFPNALFRS